MSSSSLGMAALGVVLLLALAAWIAAARRVGPLRRQQQARFVCPERHEPVECVLVQDIRTGQWKELRSCTALGPTGHCDVDCAKLMNLGFRLRSA